MASIEFIQKRIAGKEAELSKLQKKLERINKAKASNWENNPYYYSESDIRSTQRDIDDCTKSLEKYKLDLETAQNKSASRNIPAITEFLNMWEAHCIEYFRSEYGKYKVALAEYRERNHALVDKWNYGCSTKEERKDVDRQIKQEREQFHAKWSHVTQFDHGILDWDTTMQKDIAEEKNRKYDDMLDRVISITGPIVDASGLSIGDKGDLNGVIIGENGKAKLTTIGAGGYNIQVFHYRTLVHKVE